MSGRRILAENKFSISACSVSHQPFSFVGRGMTSDLDDGYTSMLRVLVDGMSAPWGGEVLIRWSEPEEGPAPDDEPEPEGWDHMVERMLVQSACQGDDDSLEALCRREWFVIFRLVSGSVPDVAEAEELTQEVFARAIASLPRFRYVGVPFRSYLSQIARNLLRDRWRQAQARPDMDGPVPDRATAELEPEAIVLAAAERHLLVEAMRRLPHRCREVLFLRVLEGRTATEIGVEWGRTPESVRQIQHRALSALRTEMADEDSR
jgi:RNA polymerase sigma-70 factor (ECF subfamily)